MNQIDLWGNPIDETDWKTRALEAEEELRRLKSRLESQYTENFIKFWKAYPNRCRKRYAAKCYHEAVARLEAEGHEDPENYIISAAEAYSGRTKDVTYCQHPSTWLNQDGFHDEAAKIEEYDHLKDMLGIPYDSAGVY